MNSYKGFWSLTLSYSLIFVYDSGRYNVTYLIEFRKLARLTSEDEQTLLLVWGECFTSINMWKGDPSSVWCGGVKGVVNLLLTAGLTLSTLSISNLVWANLPFIDLRRTNSHPVDKCSDTAKCINKCLTETQTQWSYLNFQTNTRCWLMLTDCSNTGFKIRFIEHVRAV